MQPMTSIERVTNTLDLKPVDYPPAVLNPWGETITRWKEQGRIAEDEDVAEHFSQDLRQSGWQWLHKKLRAVNTQVCSFVQQIS